MNEALVEAEISHAVSHFSIFHVKRAVASHPRKDFLVGIDFADVPQPRHQYSALRGSDHSIQSLWRRRAAEYDIHRGFPHFVGDGESMTCDFYGSNFVFVFRVLHFLRRGTRVYQPFHDAVLNQLNTLPSHAFAIKRGTGLKRMRGVIPNIDVVAEDLGLNTVIQK